MKTTLDLPDDLMIAVKIRAAKEKRKMKDVIAEALSKGLRGNSPDAGRKTLDQLSDYLAKGGLDAKKAKKWAAELAEDRENWRG